MRLPDSLYLRLERLYLSQRRTRREESRRRADEQDRRLRAYFARQTALHEAGECGGAEAGCGYVPCVPPVGFGVVR